MCQKVYMGTIQRSNKYQTFLSNECVQSLTAISSAVAELPQDICRKFSVKYIIRLLNSIGMVMIPNVLTCIRLNKVVLCENLIAKFGTIICLWLKQ